MRTIQGYSTVFPGVDENLSHKYSTYYGENMIKGTRDNFGFDDEAQLLIEFQHEAVQYAKKYNQIVVKTIEQDKCIKKDVIYIPQTYKSDEDVF